MNKLGSTSLLLSTTGYTRVVLLTLSRIEKRIRQRHFMHVVHRRIFIELGVDEEEDGHVDLFARLELLRGLLERQRAHTCSSKQKH